MDIDERPLKKRRVTPPLSDDNEEVGSGFSGLDSVDGYLEESGEEEAREKTSKRNEEIDQKYVQSRQSQPGISEKDRRMKPERHDPKPPPPAESFQLQINELLRQVKPKSSTVLTQVRSRVDRVTSVIQDAQAKGPYTLSEAEDSFTRATGVKIPFPRPRPSADVNYKFAFAQPSSISEVGGLLRGTNIKIDGNLSVDLAIQMPSSIFTEKDFLNCRYFHKRAYYLACIAKNVRQNMQDEVHLTYEHHDGNYLLPILAIQSSTASSEGGDGGSCTNIRLYPYANPTTFDVAKTRPDRNCVRSANRDGDTVGNPAATPFYNASLNSDLVTKALHDIMQGTAEKCSGYRDACLLGQVWLRQRGMGSSICEGGFGLDEWSILLALLLRPRENGGIGILLPSFGSQQLLKAALQWLARRDLLDQPLTAGLSKDPPNVSDGTPMCFATDLNYNILFKMTKWSYSMLRVEAQRSLRLLNKSAANAFENCFIIKVDEPTLRYDFVLKVHFKNMSKLTGDESLEPEYLRDAKSLGTLLEKGLRDRVDSMKISSSPARPWSVDRGTPEMSDPPSHQIGFSINSCVAMRKVDRGPSREDAQAAADFRKFWGSKCELRRFADGEIQETVVWSNREPRKLFHEIVTFLLKKHVQKDERQRWTMSGDELDNIMSGSNITVFDQVIGAYQTLENDVRSLQDFPLQLRQIKPADSALSFTSQVVPSPAVAGPGLPIDAIVQFEGSARWPDDLAAIQATKIAFLSRLGQDMKAATSQVSTSIAIENQDLENLNKSYLQVTYSSGMVFRIRIQHEREESLIEQKLKDRAITPKNRESAAAALGDYKRTFERRPAHVGAVQTLARRHAAYSPATRLLKAWFDSHLLGCHFREELIDIIMAQVFLHPYPWSTPNTPVTAFLRSLLFLSRWDWQHEPLIVDFSGDMSLKSREALSTRFQAWRKIDPAMNRVVIFAATNFDTEGTTWSEYKPSKVIAGRMSGLAKVAVDVVLREKTDLQLDRLFKTSLKDYDFIIHLATTFANTQEKQRKKGANNNAMVSMLREFCKELQSTYSEAAIFFCNVTCPAVIAGIWQPSTKRRPWRPSLPYSTRPRTDEQSSDTFAEIDKVAVLGNIARLGGDLVSSITSK